MAIEIEAKIKLNEGDLERIESLVSVDSPVIQQNTIYDLENGFLRIRYEDGKTYLTHKGKRQESEYNSREEKEVCFNEDKFDRLISCFEFLGKPFYYKKERASFEMNNCFVCIDKLPNGDYYLEVEGAEEDIEKNLDFLGLSDREIETRSYQEILK